MSQPESTLDRPALAPPSASPPFRAIPCDHCGLPVPAGLINPQSPQQFCCHGCRTVYQVLHTCGLDRYYALRAQTPTLDTPIAAPVTGRTYTECDDPAFQKLHASLEPGNLAEIEFYLEGVHCPACVWLVEHLPRALGSAHSQQVQARLNLSKRLVTIRWNPAQIKLSRIAETLDSLGYPPHPARAADQRALRRQEDRRELIQIGIAGACAGNTMLVAVALYAGNLNHMEPAYSMLFRYLSMLLGLASLLFPGRVFFRGAWAAFRTRTAHLDAPIALGLLAGGLTGVINTLRGQGEIYFDSLTVLVFLLLVGRFLQKRQQSRADEAVEALYCLTPSVACRVIPATTDRPESLEQVPIEALAFGDTVQILANESIPIDGLLLAGQSSVDQSLLTGESEPVPVQPGAQLCAGTLNLSAALRVQVTATGSQTRVGKLLGLVAESARNKAPMVLLADRISGYFLVVVLLLAAGTLGYWSWRGSPLAVDHAVALLIVACPCALGLATPLAVGVALGRAARRGILIKGGAVLEALARTGSAAGTIYLDKTGTLTLGQTALVYWQGDPALKPAICAIESQSSHPLAKAFCKAFRDLPPSPLPATEVHQDHHGGITGTCQNAHWIIGSPSFVTSSLSNHASDTPLQPWALEAQQQVLEQGLTPVLIARSGPDATPATIVAVAGFGDPLRPEVPATLAALQQSGWQLAILSGDHPAIVARLAATLGITHARGGLLPEEKLTIIQQAMNSPHPPHPTIMIGDGVNDAGALAAATVGIAVHGSAEASLLAADVYLSTPGLKAIAQLLLAARRTVRAIRWSLALSLFYNLLAVILAATGLINPLVAAILMPVSSLTVVSLALASRTFGEPKCP